MEFIAKFIELWFDYMLASLEKGSVEAIRARSTICRHILDSFINFCLSEWDCQFIKSGARLNKSSEVKTHVWFRGRA